MASGSPLDALRELLDGVPAGPDGIVVVEEWGRVVDAARVRVASVMDAPTASDLGFASPVAAVATLARVSEKTARARLVVAKSTRVDRTLTGAEVAPRLPVLAAAVSVVGVDAAELIARELSAVQARVSADALRAAEEVMVNLASGWDATGSFPVIPVSVTALVEPVRQLTATIDPDGARPREERAIRHRSFRVGTQDQDGLLPVSGRLLPEAGSLLLGMLEAHRRSPRFTAEPDPGSSDPRTADQRRHDALFDALSLAARSTDAPTLDGAPVTVVVTTTMTDLLRDGADSDPIGTLTGSTTPVTRASVHRFIDAHGFRLVHLDRLGSPHSLSSLQRCFTPAQRLQIATRDGYRCATPGCTNPHYTLQAHHVTPWRHHGPTHTDNGILLCYWHHRTIDTGPWTWRMTNGLPEVRGPGIPHWTRLPTPTRTAA